MQRYREKGWRDMGRGRRPDIKCISQGILCPINQFSIKRTRKAKQEAKERKLQK